MHGNCSLRCDSTTMLTLSRHPRIGHRRPPLQLRSLAMAFQSRMIVFPIHLPVEMSEYRTERFRRVMPRFTGCQVPAQLLPYVTHSHEANNPGVVQRMPCHFEWVGPILQQQENKQHGCRQSDLLPSAYARRTIGNTLCTAFSGSPAGNVHSATLGAVCMDHRTHRHRLETRPALHKNGTCRTHTQACTCLVT